MKRIYFFLCLFLLVATLRLQAQRASDREAQADSILSLMTLEEKIGQLNMLTGNWEATGPVLNDRNKADKLKNGEIGSMLNVKGSIHTREMQTLALGSRLGIPLLFGQDVIHGYKTIFPIPLALAASFDAEVMALAARVSAREAAVSGIHWVFSPMLDVSRDPRWGRVMEGPGEDPYLASVMAASMTRSYQHPFEDGLKVMACAKHFAAYGGAIGGRDYNTADLSLQTLHNIYLPPFRAAARHGIATFMCSFNEINGVPASANPYLYELLYKDWNYQGFVVSDWGSIREMVVHGYSKDRKQAAEQSVHAGLTIDMESNCYAEYLPELVTEGKVAESIIDRAVRQVLLQKIDLKLFEDPFRYCNEDRENNELLSAANRSAARSVAARSIILLKNENALLPVKDTPRTVAVIGPLADSRRDMDGNWVMLSNDPIAVTLLEAVRSNYPHSRIVFEKGCDITGEDCSGFDQATAAAREADLVLLALGEAWDMSGEARSKGDISLPGVQQQLATEIYKANPRTITLLMGGRPMIFEEIAREAPAILYTWWLGTEAGNAIMDVVRGEVNPSARVPMSFPRHLGQIPVYYNHKNTGRPPQESPGNYSGRYIDISHKPRYPFGYGLSYTRFHYSDITVSTQAGNLRVTLKLENTGEEDGSELVQVYLQKLWGETTRPVRELKQFRQVYLARGEEQTFHLDIPYSDLAYYGNNGWMDGSGEYKIYLGRNANDMIYEQQLHIP
ncbi:MAG: glycoside hydrolase family 3 C-terminal domain-containing protein [Bacteroides sp.]|nr:glycoside hydrolase family 3 C-terminal domain-containing protein [Bacteroides sp.]